MAWYTSFHESITIWLFPLCFPFSSRFFGKLVHGRPSSLSFSAIPRLQPAPCAATRQSLTPHPSSARRHRIAPRPLAPPVACSRAQGAGTVPAVADGHRPSGPCPAPCRPGPPRGHVPPLASQAGRSRALHASSNFHGHVHKQIGRRWERGRRWWYLRNCHCFF